MVFWRGSVLSRALAVALLLNGIAGAVSLIVALVVRHADPLACLLGLLLSLAGVAAGLLSLRALRLGLWGGLVYYAPQIVSLYTKTINFNIKSGLSMALTYSAPRMIVIVNIAALLLFGATAFTLFRSRAAKP